MQAFITGRAYNIDENTTNPDAFSAPNVTARNITQLNNQISATNNNVQGGSYIINNHSINPNIRNGVTSTLSLSLSPNGTIHSSSTNDGNYLEPITATRVQQMPRLSAAMRLNSLGSGPISPDMTSPGSPSSYSNILELTQLNPLPAHSNNYGNIYQEYPTGFHSNTIIKTNPTSVETTPSEPAPCSLVKSPSSNNENCNIYMNSDIVENAKELLKDSKISPSHTNPISANEPSSPSSVKLNLYMNVAVGECNSNNPSLVGTPPILDSRIISSLATPPVTGSSTTKRDHSKTSSNGSTFVFNRTYSTDPSRCYENFDPVIEMKPFLTRHRYSRPEIFSKVDLPAGPSEPCTPTVAERKFNYIELDLDHTPTINGIGNNNDNICSSNINSASVTNVDNNDINLNDKNNNNNLNNNLNNCNDVSDNLANEMSMSTSISLTNGIGSGLPPESPQKAALGYATIDFKKTVALSNSTNLDNEGCRKTRHNSNVTPASISTISTGRHHSNSISD